MTVWNLQVCDVCRIMDRDTSKKLCYYCGKCDAQICWRDSQPGAWFRRAQAAAWRQWEKFHGVSA